MKPNVLYYVFWFSNALPVVFASAISKKHLHDLEHEDLAEEHNVQTFLNLASRIARSHNESAHTIVPTSSHQRLFTPVERFSFLSIPLGGYYGLIQIVCVAFCFLLSGMLLGHEGMVSWTGSSPFTTACSSRRSMQAAYLVWWVFLMMDPSIVIPTSFELSQEMGCSPATSGLLIGAGFLTSPIASIGGAYIFKRYSQNAGRVTSICGILLLSAQNLGMGIALDRKQHHGPNTMWVLIGFRVMCGIGKISYIGQYMAYAVTPKADRTALSIATAVATNLGLCLGPFLSAITIQMLGGREVVHSVYTRSSASLYIMALLWAGLAICFALSFPICTLDPMKPNDPSDAAHRLTPRSERLSIQDREKIVVQGVLYTMERGISVGAIEAGTAMLLELQFGWGARAIGLGISSVFAFTIVTCCILMYLNVKRVVLEANMLVSVAAVAAVGGVLLFDFHTGYALQLLLADCLIYPFMYSASAAADGLATRVAIPDTWYSMESYLAMKGAGQALFRFMGFPLARFLIDKGGRNVYATTLLTLGCLGLFSAGKIAWLCEWREIFCKWGLTRADEEKASPFFP